VRAASDAEPIPTGASPAASFGAWPRGVALAAVLGVPAAELVAAGGRNPTVVDFLRMVSGGAWLALVLLAVRRGREAFHAATAAPRCGDRAWFYAAVGVVMGLAAVLEVAGAPGGLGLGAIPLLYVFCVWDGHASRDTVADPIGAAGLFATAAALTAVVAGFVACMAVAVAEPVPRAAAVLALGAVPPAAFAAWLHLGPLPSPLPSRGPKPASPLAARLLAALAGIAAGSGAGWAGLRTGIPAADASVALLAGSLALLCLVAATTAEPGPPTGAPRPATADPPPPGRGAATP
jgi:hypothetical protein